MNVPFNNGIIMTHSRAEFIEEVATHLESAWSLLRDTGALNSRRYFNTNQWRFQRSQAMHKIRAATYLLTDTDTFLETSMVGITR